MTSKSVKPGRGLTIRSSRDRFAARLTRYRVPQRRAATQSGLTQVLDHRGNVLEHVNSLARRSLQLDWSGLLHLRQEARRHASANLWTRAYDLSVLSFKCGCAASGWSRALCNPLGLPLLAPQLQARLARA